MPGGVRTERGVGRHRVSCISIAKGEAADAVVVVVVLTLPPRRSQRRVPRLPRLTHTRLIKDALPHTYRSLLPNASRLNPRDLDTSLGASSRILGLSAPSTASSTPPSHLALRHPRPSVLSTVSAPCAAYDAARSALGGPHAHAFHHRPDPYLRMSPHEPAAATTAMAAACAVHRGRRTRDASVRSGGCREERAFARPCPPSLPPLAFLSYQPRPAPTPAHARSLPPSPPIRAPPPFPSLTPHPRTRARHSPTLAITRPSRSQVGCRRGGGVDV
ncbi:hypothetical protein B0H12DRAFT_1246658 [Mycena haematopus]|nr:hypothetical protein B0H12DRAFT_1246658 [Mycena haematopus]